MIITDYAVLYQGNNADWIAMNMGRLLVPQSPEMFTHDADGNLTQDGRWNYTWDLAHEIKVPLRSKQREARRQCLFYKSRQRLSISRAWENRLIKLESRTGAPNESKRRLEFAYDFRGRRIWKKVTNLHTSTVTLEEYFLYDGWNLAAVINSSSAITKFFAWGLDLSGTMQGAGGVGGLLWGRMNGPAPRFTAFDGNGNVSALVNGSAGGVDAQYEYGPFGELLRATGWRAKDNPFRFSTKYQDDETDQLYYGYRFFNASLGRWPNRDPLGERGGVNLYGFVGNDPLGFIDPDGLLSLGSFINGSVGTHSLTLPLGPTTLTGSITWKRQPVQCCYDVTVNLELAWSPQTLVTSSLRYFGGRLGGRIADVLPKIEVGGGAEGTFVYCPPDTIKGNPNIRIYAFGQAAVGAGGGHNSGNPRPPYEDWGLNPPTMNGFWGQVRVEISGNLNVKTWTVSYDGTYLQLGAGYRYQQYTWENNFKWKIHP